jgi:two-component system, NarL family, sensor kinase
VREQVGRDIHDDMGAGLSALKLRSEMALEMEPDPAKRLHFADQATIADELMGSMRQIIWAMNGEQSNVEDLVLYTTAYARNYCAGNNLELDVVHSGPWPVVELSAEQRRNLFLVVKEALHNMVKHAGADRANLRMEWADGLTVEVADNGKGLSLASDKSKGNGLQNIEKRVTMLGGDLTIDGTHGTRIRFHVPLTVSERNKSSVAFSGT